MGNIELLGVAIPCLIVAWLIRPQPHRKTPDQILDEVLGERDEHGRR